MIICNLRAAIRIYANQQGERPRRGPLRDREIFVKVRLKLYSYCILLLSSITACYSVRRLQCKVVTSLLSSDTDKWGHFIVSSINANIIFTTIHYPPSAMLPHTRSWTAGQGGRAFSALPGTQQTHVGKLQVIIRQTQVPMFYKFQISAPGQQVHLSEIFWQK